MNVIEPIVAQINVLIGKRFSDVDLFGVAESAVVRDESEFTYPVIINANGECYHIFDDSHILGIYHRVNSTTFGETETLSFGDRRKTNVSFDMSLIAYGRRDTNNQYDVEATITRILANFFEGTKTYTSPTMSIFNRQTIFAQEYSGINFPFSPETFLIKINYKINTQISVCE